MVTLDRPVTFDRFGTSDRVGVPASREVPMSLLNLRPSPARRIGTTGPAPRWY
ncbi:hypothetical protein [Streptomyces sp. NPDC003719]